MIGVLLLFLFIANANSADIDGATYVDPASTCTSTCGGTPLNAFTTIADAVKATSAGGTIYLSAGVHVVDGTAIRPTTFTINKRLTIIGRTPGATVVLMKSPGVVFNLDAGAAGTIISDMKITASDLNPVWTANNGAIWVKGLNGVTVRDVDIFGFGSNTADGIPYDNAAAPFGIRASGPASNLTIDRVQIWNTYWSLIFEGTSTGTVTNTVVRGDHFAPGLFLNTTAGMSPYDWIFENVWWAQKDNSYASNDPRFHYVVYIAAGKAQFINTTTEMFYMPGAYQCSDHFYVGSNGNSWINHNFVGGGAPKNKMASCGKNNARDKTQEGYSSCAIRFARGKTGNTLGINELTPRDANVQYPAKICFTSSEDREHNSIWLVDPTAVCSGAECKQ